MTASKLFGVTQEDYLDMLSLMQRCLASLNKYFPNITPLSTSELKDSFINSQSPKFKANLTKSRAVMNDATIKDLLEFFLELQFLDNPTSNSRNYQPRQNMQLQQHVLFYPVPRNNSNVQNQFYLNNMNLSMPCNRPPN